jgi:EmrB/QacA subfamily drug resistance transporter
VTTTSVQSSLHTSSSAPAGDAHSSNAADNDARWRMLPVILTATFMALFDFFVVNVAAPSLEHDLHASGAALQLIVGGYGFSYATGLVTGGRLGDLFGYRRMFISGMIAFSLASLLCGLAQTPGELIGARLLQGFTAAAMVPQVLALITATFPADERPRAMSWFGVAIGSGSVAGQVIGGLLLNANIFGLGWRAIFLVNVPIGAAASLLALRLVPTTRGTNRPHFDLAGALGLAGGLGLILVPLVLGRSEGWPTWTWISMAASLPALYGVLRWEQRLRRINGQPLVDLTLFRDRSFSAGLAINAAFLGLFASFMLGLTLLLQSGLGLSPLHSGLTFGPLGVMFAIASVFGQRLVARYGVGVISAGAAISGLGLTALLFELWALGGSITAPELIPAMVVVGLGNGMSLPALIGVVISRVRASQAGAAAGMLTTAQQFAGAAGVALIGVVFYAGLGSHPHAASYVNAMIRLVGMDLALIAVVLVLTAFIRRPAVVDLAELERMSFEPEGA